MTTLYNRASPPQARILRAIEGAIKNVSDAHKIPFDQRYARSVAKRAAGTLTAQWPDVLAATSAPPGWVVAGQGTSPARPAGEQVPIRLRLAQMRQRARRGQSQYVGRLAPLRALERTLHRQMRDVRLSGNTERVEAFIYVLREIAKLLSTPSTSTPQSGG